MPTKSLTSAEAGSQGLTIESMLQDCVACGVLAVDAQGKIVSLTGESGRAIQVPPVPNPALALQTLPAPMRAIVQEVQQTGRVVADRQVALHSGAAGVVTLSVSAVPLAPDTSGVSVVVVVRDISPAGRMQQNLRRLDRLASVGTLSASMAHELKNALVAVKTFIGMQLEENRDAELAAIARREMERVDSILNNMLKFAAPAQPEFSAVRLHEILDHSLRLVQHRIGVRLISFKREFNAANDACSGDDHQLQQAFVNLLFNAVDAIGSEGALTVSTDLIADESQARLREGGGAPRSLRVKISDTGVGIPPEHLARLFEPFFTTKTNGTGLGLAVTRGIISEHKGAIHVESRPGKGTTFTILLPTAAADQSA
jgi:signal transduction histidine kinase